MREKVSTQPQKNADYLTKGTGIYVIERQRGCRNMEDVRPESSTGNGAEGEPRLTVGWPRRKPKDNSTSGSPVLLARNAQRRPSPRARMRDMHEIQADSDADGWKNEDAGARGTMGYGMSGLRRTPAAFKARQPNAAGTNRSVLQVD